MQIITMYNSSFDFASHNISLAHSLTHVNIAMDFIFFWKKNALGKFNLYCSEGKICLSSSDIPDEIEKLYVDSSDKFKNFKANIHKILCKCQSAPRKFPLFKNSGYGALQNFLSLLWKFKG